VGTAAGAQLNAWIDGANGAAPNQDWVRCYSKSG